MSDEELDGLLRAAVRAEAPDWLEQLVTERAVATVRNEAPVLGASARRLQHAVAGFARRARRYLRPAFASELRGRVGAALMWPRGVLLGASTTTKGE